MSKDYYKVLGVERSANAEEIKKAFHKLAHQHHPDKAGGDEAKFKEINEAYQVLSNKDKRAQYDQFGQTFNGAGANGGGFGGFNGAQGFDFGDLGDMFGGFGDIFGFGGGQQSRQPQRGADVELVLDLDFLEAAFGVEKELRFKKAVRCGRCQGQGVEPGAKVDTCPVCRGRGRVAKIQRTILGNIQMETVCSDCRGTGKRVSQYCRDCSGSGIVKDMAHIQVKIPAGINDGESVRFPGQGEAGQEASPAGDLYVRIAVRADKRWQRQGYDIKTKLTLTLSEATLGTKKVIETISGPVDLKIPDGTQPGKVFTLRGAGVPRLKSSGRGEHLVEVVVAVPERLSRSQKKLMEELAKEGL